MHQDAQWSISGTPRSPTPEVPAKQPAKTPPEAPAPQVAETPAAVAPNKVPEKAVITPEQVPGDSLTREAVNKRLQRIFKPRVDGTFLVSEDWVKKWQSKGSERDQLLVMFEKCDYGPDRVGENIACFQSHPNCVDSTIELSSMFLSIKTLETKNTLSKLDML